jgi:hypothetical protein
MVTIVALWNSMIQRRRRLHNMCAAMGPTAGHTTPERRARQVPLEMVVLPAQQHRLTVCSSTVRAAFRWPKSLVAHHPCVNFLYGRC